MTGVQTCALPILTFCCQQATVITNFSDLERIGRTHRLNLSGGAMPTEEYAKLNGRAEALRLIDGGGEQDWKIRMFL